MERGFCNLIKGPKQVTLRRFVGHNFAGARHIALWITNYVYRMFLLVAPTYAVGRREGQHRDETS